MAWHKTGAEQEVFPTGPTDIMFNLTLVQVLVLNQAGDKPLPKQMMTQSIDANMDKASMSWTARWHDIWPLYYLIFHTPYTSKLIHVPRSCCVLSYRHPDLYKQ